MPTTSCAPRSRTECTDSFSIVYDPGLNRNVSWRSWNSESPLDVNGENREFEIQPNGVQTVIVKYPWSICISFTVHWKNPPEADVDKKNLSLPV